ncbi:MAG: hypothetical protein Q4A07_04960 [Coriobacteriales bacterium]|nr:hypothetical protein [Coriobacteriales bacterium]
MQSTHDTYLQNHQVLLQALRTDGDVQDNGKRLITLVLERFLIDREHNLTVSFFGECGIEALLQEVAKSWSEYEQVWHNNHLMGLVGNMEATIGSPITLEVELGPGGQIICKAGPSTSIEGMLKAIDAFDRQLHVVSYDMGCDYALIAEGYNPLTTSPLDVSLVPRTRWTLLNAHLGKTGRYARDVMRCACATRVVVGPSAQGGIDHEYRVATALSPVLAFLTDNVRSFRDTDTRHTQRMTRSMLWGEVDQTRCGVVPHTFDEGPVEEHVAQWLEGIQPIFIEGEDGAVTPTAKSTLGDVMHQRTIGLAQAQSVLRTAFPCVRLQGGSLELTQADSLRPTMAAGYAAFIKGLFSSEFSVGATEAALGIVCHKDVVEAGQNLRKDGWSATVYNQGVASLVDQLLQIVRTQLDPQEQHLLNSIAEQWEVHMVPRDAFVHQAIKATRGW